MTAEVTAAELILKMDINVTLFFLTLDCGFLLLKYMCEGVDVNSPRLNHTLVSKYNTELLSK